MVSSASAQIETGQRHFFPENLFWFPVLVGGEHLKTYILEKGNLVQVPDYAKVRACQTGRLPWNLIIGYDHSYRFKVS